MENNISGNETPQRIMEMMRGCLALTKSSNEHEAANALARLTMWLDRYNLTVADIEEKTNRTPELIEGKIEYGQPWVAILIHKLGRENFCDTVRHPHNKTISVLGRAPNVYTTYEMCLWLQGQLEQLALKAQKEYTQYRSVNGCLKKGASPRQYRIDFLLGATNRVIERLREANKWRRAYIPNMFALVLRLDAESKEFSKKKYPHTIVSHYSSKGSGGFADGHAAGDGVSLTPPSRHISSDSGRYLGAGKGG